ncbi:hypothetical protein Csa_018391 [Cucumis sativus]|nr:hypothetical protein Csa_018391 [Cucumis sativus]
MGVSVLYLEKFLERCSLCMAKGSIGRVLAPEYEDESTLSLHYILMSKMSFGQWAFLMGISVLYLEKFLERCSLCMAKGSIGRVLAPEYEDE